MKLETAVMEFMDKHLDEKMKGLSGAFVINYTKIFDRCSERYHASVPLSLVTLNSYPCCGSNTGGNFEALLSAAYLTRVKRFRCKNRRDQQVGSYNHIFSGIPRNPLFRSRILCLRMPKMFVYI